GTPMPAWASGTGQVRCVEALINLDVFGDQTQYLALYEYDSGAVGPDHLVVATIDHPSGRVEELGVLAPGRPALAGVRADDNPYLELLPADLSVMRADIVEAIERTDAAPELAEDGYLTQWAFVLARILALPVGAPRRGVQEAERERLVREFIDGYGSQLAAARSLDSAVVAAGARLAIDWAVDTGSRDPLRWSPTAVDAFLLEWMPQQQVAPEVASWLPEVLAALIGHGGERRGQAPEVVHITREQLAGNSGRYTELMMGEGSRDSMDDVMMRMLAAGVDPDDDAAVRKWLEEYVQRPGDPDDPR
ncbi:MAG: hypothetical protein ACRDTM_13150, partial [Micromonosporaceae bacterium]